MKQVNRRYAEATVKSIPKLLAVVVEVFEPMYGDKAADVVNQTSAWLVESMGIPPQGLDVEPLFPLKPQTYLPEWVTS